MHKHDLEWSIWSTEIFCMYDDCEFRIYRDDIQRLVELCEKFFIEQDIQIIETITRSNKVFEELPKFVEKIWQIVRNKEE